MEQILGHHGVKEENMRRHIRETLPNGVKICAVFRPGVESVSIMVAVKSGSDYESPELAGMSHFLEHMCFRGTQTYTSPKAVFRILDSAGPDSNATTAQEDVIFFKKCSASSALQVVDVLFEMIASPLLRKEDVKIEKGPVKEELTTAQNSPDGICHLLAVKTLYGDQPAGRDIGGTVETVSGFSVDDVRRYHRQIAVGPNIFVVAVGKIEERLLDAVRERFSRIPSGIPFFKPRTLDVFTGPVCRFLYHSEKQMYLYFAVKTFDYYSPMVLPLQVLGTALGGMASSVLFEEMRVERGLVYHVSAENDFFSDRGLFEITCEFAPRKLEQVVKTVLRCLARSDAINGKYIDRAKNNMIEGVDLGFEDSLVAAQIFVERELCGLPFLSQRQQKERIASVSHDDVRAVASQIFRPERLCVVGVGPIRSDRRLETARSIVESAFC